jgi:hypothetical protein
MNFCLAKEKENLNFGKLQASTYKADEPSPGATNSSGYRKDKVRRKKLTAQKRKEIKEAFDLFDIDGSGSTVLIKPTRCFPWARPWRRAVVAYFRLSVFHLHPSRHHRCKGAQRCDEVRAYIYVCVLNFESSI